jgi:hypothetical protein
MGRPRRPGGNADLQGGHAQNRHGATTQQVDARADNQFHCAINVSSHRNDHEVGEVDGVLLPSYFYHSGVFFQFIQPCHPQRAKTVPAGDDWQHEIKFDGFRVQIHKLGDDVV